MSGSHSQEPRREQKLMARQAWVRVKCTAAMVGPEPELGIEGRTGFRKGLYSRLWLSQIQDVNRLSGEPWR